MLLLEDAGRAPSATAQGEQHLPIRYKHDGHVRKQVGLGFVTGRGKMYSGGIVRRIFTKKNSCFREIIKHIQFVGPDL